MDRIESWIFMKTIYIGNTIKIYIYAVSKIYVDILQFVNYVFINKTICLY